MHLYVGNMRYSHTTNHRLLPWCPKVESVRMLMGGGNQSTYLKPKFIISVFWFSHVTFLLTLDS